tara:strand:+ start:579 stop:965 length:387 start_codon:yes stop_codon:yes gene_type:complete
MKITKTQLRQIIKEEVENTLDEFQAGSIAQKSSAGKHTLVKTINANVKTIEKMAEEFMSEEFMRARDLGFPFGSMIQDFLNRKLKEQGFDDTRLDAVHEYLKTFAKNKELRKYLNRPGLTIADFEKIN